MFLAIFYQQFFKRVTLLPVIISMPRPWVIGLIGAYGFLRQRVRIADRHSLRVADIAGVVLVERPGGWRSQNRREMGAKWGWARRVALPSAPTVAPAMPRDPRSRYRREGERAERRW